MFCSLWDYEIKAGRQGFEPWVEFKALQPLSRRPRSSTPAPPRERPRNRLERMQLFLAEGEGFEPPDLSINGFQDRRNRPLCHPSETRTTPLHLTRSIHHKEEIETG